MKIDLQKIGTFLIFAPFLLIYLPIPFFDSGDSGLAIALLLPSIVGALVVCGLIIKLEGFAKASTDSGAARLKAEYILLFLLYLLFFLNMFGNFIVLNVSEDNTVVIALFYLFPALVHAGVYLTRSVLSPKAQSLILVGIFVALFAFSYVQQVARETTILKSITNPDGYIYCEEFKSSLGVFKSPLEGGNACSGSSPYHSVYLLKDFRRSGYSFTIVGTTDIVNAYGVPIRTYKIKASK